MSNNFKCRQNWGEQCEQDLNKQINLELLASHQYLFLSSHFNRDDVALKPFSDFLNKCSLEERGHAQKLIDYQNMRGGIVVLTNVADPNIKFTSNNKVLEALNFVLILEKTVNKSLLDLHTTAENDNDPQFGDYIEGEFLNEQVEAISEISKYITQIEFIGNNNYGIWEFINNTFS
jgi:ferritin heavy chain